MPGLGDGKMTGNYSNLVKIFLKKEISLLNMFWFCLFSCSMKTSAVVAIISPPQIINEELFILKAKNCLLELLPPTGLPDTLQAV